jgi:hypothetical protein
LSDSGISGSGRVGSACWVRVISGILRLPISERIFFK